MTELQRIESILNGPVHCHKLNDFYFYFTKEDDSSYVFFDHMTGDWTVSLHNLVSVKANTLALAANMAKREFEELKA